MNFEHNNIKPDYFKENWEGKWQVFSWLEFVCAIPNVLFMVTTSKANGLPNAAFQSWSSFTGEGNHYYIIMSGLMKHTHTYENILRNQEFCINFIDRSHLEHCWKSIKENGIDTDEITEAGFTVEASKTIGAPRIKESFLKLECAFVWEKELHQNSFNMTICGEVKHVSVEEKFASAETKDKYGDDTFMFNLHNPQNPFTGDYFGGGVGTIEYKDKM